MHNLMAHTNPPPSLAYIICLYYNYSVHVELKETVSPTQPDLLSCWLCDADNCTMFVMLYFLSSCL